MIEKMFKKIKLMRSMIFLLVVFDFRVFPLAPLILSAFEQTDKQFYNLFHISLLSYINDITIQRT